MLLVRVQLGEPPPPLWPHFPAWIRACGLLTECFPSVTAIVSFGCRLYRNYAVEMWVRERGIGGKSQLKCNQTNQNLISPLYKIGDAK